MTQDEVQAWLDAYVEAWRSYDPEAIGARSDLRPQRPLPRLLEWFMEHRG